MKGTTRAERIIADKVWSVETGRLAPQADGAVVATVGETQVLATAMASRSVREGQDFFPLTVDVEEKMYAAGKIPGSFFRKEGRASDQAILVCRLIDRSLRPSFPEGFRNEVQVIITVLATDQENPHDVLALNAASAALAISGMPFDGPVGGVRISLIDGRWVVNPTYAESEAGVFDLVVAGRRNDHGEIDIMMVEAGATESAWEHIRDGQPAPTEAAIVDGLEVAKAAIAEMIELQLELRAQVEVTPLQYELHRDYTEDLLAAVEAAATGTLRTNITIANKAERAAANADLADSVVAQLADTFGEQEKPIRAAIRAVEKRLVRERILAEGARIDGRGPTDIRPLIAEVGVVPRVHGSGLFQRGETQVLTILTLGMLRMAQTLDTIWLDESKRYMHNYNMPPFSTGETGFMRGPKRREIGHGALAEKALLCVVPDEDEFPYALRLVSEVLSSNGSTSMASVCASSLSLMDAGVPIKAPVAGIAMGLVHGDGRFVTLTDIIGAEDAFGDMDFKVAGTEDFVTALQLDTKIQGLPAQVLADALAQARDARLEILRVMREAIERPRAEMNPTAPRITAISVPVDKIGEVIGPKGKVIQEIQRDTGADIDVDDDGTIRVGASHQDAVDAAVEWISSIVNPPMAEVGKEYTGRVVNITNFGAFVNILPGRDGLVHISKLGAGRRLDRVEDVLSIGDELTVRVDEIDTQGRVNLTPIAGPEGAVGDTSQLPPPPADARSRDRDRRRGERYDRDRGRDRDRDRDSERDRDRRGSRGEARDVDRGGRRRGRSSRGGYGGDRRVRDDRGGAPREAPGGDVGGKPRREVVSFEEEFERNQ